MAPVDWTASARSCRQRSTDLYIAAFRLPAGLRRRVFALLAFFHDLEDRFAAHAASGGARLQQETLALSGWLDALYADQPIPERAHRALQDTVRVAAIPRALFVELIDGLALDLVRPRYRDWVQLQQHCRTRAVVPALMLAAALDIEPALAKKAATPLGNAWQLTRVLTQIGPDLDRGRIYIPQQDLALFSVSEIDLVSRRLTPGINDLIAFEVDRSQRLLDEARALLRDLSDHPGAAWLRSLLAHRGALLRRVGTDPALALAKDPVTLSLAERFCALRA